MSTAQRDFELSSSWPRPNWSRRLLWLAAIALPMPLIATILFVPLPGKRISAANFRGIRVGMSESELRELLGVPRYESVEMGLVNGPTNYTVNFAKTDEELRARGFKEYVRYVWMSPEITITSIVDTDEKVVCAYSSGGQSRNVRGFLGLTTTRQLRPAAVTYADDRDSRSRVPVSD